jgi:hypothetical protein
LGFNYGCKKQITFTYHANEFGLQDWAGTNFYFTTWDISSELGYRPISTEGGQWFFGGAALDAPRIMDDVRIQIPLH